MKKPRTNKLPNLTTEQVEAFAAKADQPEQTEPHYSKLDTTASKNFKSTVLPFNEYEHTVLSLAVEKAGYKSAKQFIREAMISRALHILEGKPYGDFY